MTSYIHDALSKHLCKIARLCRHEGVFFPWQAHLKQYCCLPMSMSLFAHVKKHLLARMLTIAFINRCTNGVPSTDVHLYISVWMHEKTSIRALTGTCLCSCISLYNSNAKKRLCTHEGTTICAREAMSYHMDAMAHWPNLCILESMLPMRMHGQACTRTKQPLSMRMESLQRLDDSWTCACKP